MNCVKIVDSCPLKESGNNLPSYTSSSNWESTSSYEDDGEDDMGISQDADGSSVLKKHKRPQIPLADISVSSHDLANEIKLTLQTISSSIFAVYSKSNFEFYDKLVALYNDLDNLRVSLISGILSKREERMSKKKVSFLMNKFSKLLASGGGLIDRSQHSKCDIDGKEAIVARNEDTAELYTLGNDVNIESPAKIAQSQVLSALTPNYPWGQASSSFVPQKNSKYDHVPPSNIMVNVSQVVASSPVTPLGYAGMKAYMYLRDSKKRLTEAFAINISPDQDISLDNLAAAMFTNIPAEEINGGRIYLVALLTETIADVNSKSPEKVESGTELELSIIRKGICAGVADISRIFSRRKGHLISGQAHRFSIKLFSSFMDSHKQEVKLFQGMSSMLAKSMTMVNNGWGELVDRIITGSNRGVAINPRAERLILHVKEMKLSPENMKTLDSISENADSALACIPMLSYDPAEKESNRVFLRVISTSLNQNQFKERGYITVHVKGSSKTQRFSKGANEAPQPVWRFLSTAPDEQINELIVVTGFPEIPTQGNDFLVFNVYSNKEFIGTAHYLVRSGNTIPDTGLFGKNVKSLDILGPNNTSAGTVNFEIEYVGKTYNVDKFADKVINWRNQFAGDLKANEQAFIECLSSTKKIKQYTLVAEFSIICEELIAAFDSAVTLKLPSLQKAIFEALVSTLDIVVARNEENISIFNAMLQKKGSKLAKVGEHFLSFMSAIFNNHETEWTSIGRAVCRTSILLLRIVAKCFANTNSFQTQATEFSLSISNFVKSDKENLVAEQLLVIGTFEMYLEVFKPWFNSTDLVNFIVMWVNSNYLRGLGSVADENLTALVNRKRNREHMLLIEKLLFINRVLHGPVISYGGPGDRKLIIGCALDLSLAIITAEKIDLECTRLSLSVVLAICETSFGKGRLFYDDSKQLYFTLIKLLPLFCREFSRYKTFYIGKNLMKKKRTFTELFPSSFPFTEYTMDSIVNDCIFSEVLVEITIIIGLIVKMFEAHDSTFSSTELAHIQTYPLLEEKFKPGSISESLSVILAVSHDILSSHYYPRDIWLSLHGLSVETSYLLCMTVKNVLPDPQRENITLWIKFIINMLGIAITKPSSIEHLEITPKMASYFLLGDIRSKVAPVVNVSWEKLGSPSSLEDKARFQLEKFNGLQTSALLLGDNTFLHYLFLFSLQRSKPCLTTGGKILWSIMAAGVAKDESLFELERDSVSALYDVFERKNSYTAELMEINSFIHMLQKISERMDPEDTDISLVSKFVTTLSNYLSSLSDLKRIPNGDEFDDDRTFHSLNISSFLLNVDKPELFQSFVNEMFEKNLSKGNFVQAALSLELLANTYDWDINTYLPACRAPHLPSQTSFKRKIDLFKIVAHNFIKGQKLEQAVDIYTEMLNAYMSSNFDLAGISTCHSELGSLYESLQTVDRLESAFFKISFIGLGFPESLRDKEFIYEGMPYERITSINNRLTRLYPGSKIISSDAEASKMSKQKPLGKFLHIKAVTPDKSRGSSDMSFMANQYMANRNLNSFVSSRRLPGASSILNLWTEETTYTTYMTFPTLMNRSEIKHTKTVKVPPVKNAVKSLFKKNEELANLEYLIHKNLKDNISLAAIAASPVFENLSRILAGTVDFPVNGGAGEFKVFLLDNNDIDKGESEEEFSRDCMVMKKSFFRLVYLLNNLLKLHGMIAPESLKPQHQSMVELFKKNFAFEIEQSRVDVNTPLKYTHLMNSLTSTNVHSKHRHHHTEGSEGTYEHGSQLTRTSSHNTINSNDRKPSSISGRSKQHSYGFNASFAGIRSSGLNTSRDDSSITMSDFSQFEDSSLSKLTMNSSLKKATVTKKTNILNYK